MNCQPTNGISFKISKDWDTPRRRFGDFGAKWTWNQANTCCSLGSQKIRSWLKYSQKTESNLHTLPNPISQVLESDSIPFWHKLENNKTATIDHPQEERVCKEFSTYNLCSLWRLELFFMLLKGIPRSYCYSLFSEGGWRVKWMNCQWHN